MSFPLRWSLSILLAIVSSFVVAFFSSSVMGYVAAIVLTLVLLTGFYVIFAPMSKNVIQYASSAIFQANRSVIPVIAVAVAAAYTCNSAATVVMTLYRMIPSPRTIPVNASFVVSVFGPTRSIGIVRAVATASAFGVVAGLAVLGAYRLSRWEGVTNVITSAFYSRSGGFSFDTFVSPSFEEEYICIGLDGKITGTARADHLVKVLKQKPGPREPGWLKWALDWARRITG